MILRTTAKIRVDLGFTEQHFRTWWYPAGAKLVRPEVVGRLEHILRLRLGLLRDVLGLLLRLLLQRQIVGIVDVVVVDVGSVREHHRRLDKHRSETLRYSDGDVVQRGVLISGQQMAYGDRRGSGLFRGNWDDRGFGFRRGGREILILFCRARRGRWSNRKFYYVGIPVGVKWSVLLAGLLR